MPFLNQGEYIEEAIESVVAQTYSAWELLLVDDGSTDNSTSIARAYEKRDPERFRYFEHPGHANLGASASRNVGIQNARGEYIALLDADDVWLPQKLELQVSILDARPHLGSVYGNTLYWHSWSPSSDAGEDYIPPLGIRPGTELKPPALAAACLSGRAAVPCTCSILMRRSDVDSIGGFEESFHSVFTDQSFYVKLFMVSSALVTDHCLDRYRQHDASSCAVAEKRGQLKARRLAYLQWVETYLNERNITDSTIRNALAEAYLPHRHPRVYQMRRLIRRSIRKVRAALDHTARIVLPARKYDSLRRWIFSSRPRAGRVKFGNFRRLTPISAEFGYDRGQPVDRYYIETFLDRHRADVAGRVLEVGDAAYTQRFGDARVRRSDVLHVSAESRRATIVADLADGGAIPDEAFDCVICTQTLHFIYDFHAAARTLHRILKPGGVLLLTVPGITPIDRRELHTWFWSFTAAAARRVFEGLFPAESVAVEAAGNVLSATAFLHGLSAGELRPDELDVHDECFPVVVTVRAVK